MGATGTPVVAGPSRYLVGILTKGDTTLVPFTSTMSTSYATGGDTLTLPTADMKGMELRDVLITNQFDGTRIYYWDGNLAVPRIKAIVALTGAEAIATTNLSAITLRGYLIYMA